MYNWLGKEGVNIISLPSQSLNCLKRREKLSDQTCTNQAIAGAKRKMESEMQTLHVSSF